MNNEINDFCRKYDAIVQPSKHRQRRTKLQSFDDWYQNPDMFQPVSYEYDTIPCVEIHMPEDRFRALIEHDEWLEHAGLKNNSFFNNNVGRVSNILEEHERECRIRQENPAVRAAWEKYQTLLRLVDSHYD
jgi:hypothetical protein